MTMMTNEEVAVLAAEQIIAAKGQADGERCAARCLAKNDAGTLVTFDWRGVASDASRNAGCVYGVQDIRQGRRIYAYAYEAGARAVCQTALLKGSHADAAQHR